MGNPHRERPPANRRLVMVLLGVIVACGATFGAGVWVGWRPHGGAQNAAGHQDNALATSSPSWTVAGPAEISATSSHEQNHEPSQPDGANDNTPKPWADLVTAAGGDLVAASGRVGGDSGGGMRALAVSEWTGWTEHGVWIYTRTETSGEDWVCLGEVRHDGEFVQDIRPWWAPDKSQGGIAVIGRGGAGNRWRFEILRRNEAEDGLEHVCNIIGAGGDNNLPFSLDVDGDGLRELVSLDEWTATGDHEYRKAEIWKWNRKTQKYDLWRKSAKLKVAVVEEGEGE